MIRLLPLLLLAATLPASTQRAVWKDAPPVAAYRLPLLPSPDSEVFVYANGLLLLEGADYSLVRINSPYVAWPSFALVVMTRADWADWDTPTVQVIYEDGR